MCFSATAMNHARSSAGPIVCQRRAGDVVEADGVPVILGAHPPELLAGAVDGGTIRREDAALQILADQLPRRGRQPVAQQITGRGQFHAQTRRAEVYFDRLAAKIFQLSVVRRQNPRPLGAERGDGLLQRRKETAFVFKAFGEGEDLNPYRGGRRRPFASGCGCRFVKIPGTRNPAVPATAGRRAGPRSRSRRSTPGGGRRAFPTRRGW